MATSKGLSKAEVQLSMTGPELTLLKMIKFKQVGPRQDRRTCTKQDYREAASMANVNAYDHDNFRKNQGQVKTPASY